jgi:hypothetical protein
MPDIQKNTGSIESNKEDSAYAMHIISKRHQFGKMENITQKRE